MEKKGASTEGRIVRMNEALKIVTSRNFTTRQKMTQLAAVGENSVSPMKVPEKFRFYADKGALCDMNEGNAPYRPRYVLPDYQKFLDQGSSFLRLDPPKDLDEALNALSIIYHHVPSITGMPVYVGALDTLIDPFLEGVDDAEAAKKISLFLNFIDRTIPSGYCHANIGPEDTRAGRIILSLAPELKNAVPNITMKYDPDITPDDFAESAMGSAMVCAGPAVCNHAVHKETYTGRYGVVSCYNILPEAGGAYCLSRIVLPRLAEMAENHSHFLSTLLPDALNALGEYMNERIRFFVEESGFFESSFLVDEGLISTDRFIGMFGLAGLADCVNILLGREMGYGGDEEGDNLAETILSEIAVFAANFEAPYSPVSGGHHMLHAQAGLATDEGVSPGIRIRVGEEPESLFKHLRHSARMHKYIPTGCSDIFPVESTAGKNPAALVDVIKGAFSVGDKYLSFYASDGDLVRITGYLAKRSEIDRFKDGTAVLHDTVAGASLNYKNNRVGQRKVRTQNDLGSGK